MMNKPSIFPNAHNHGQNELWTEEQEEKDNLLDNPTLSTEKKKKKKNEEEEKEDNSPDNPALGTVKKKKKTKSLDNPALSTKKKMMKKKTIHLTIPLSAQRRMRRRRNRKRRQFIRQPHSQHNLLPWISFLSLPEASQKATARAASFLSRNNHRSHS